MNLFFGWNVLSSHVTLFIVVVLVIDFSLGSFDVVSSQVVSCVELLHLLASSWSIYIFSLQITSDVIATSLFWPNICQTTNLSERLMLERLIWIFR